MGVISASSSSFSAYKARIKCHLPWEAFPPTPAGTLPSGPPQGAESPHSSRSVGFFTIRVNSARGSFLLNPGAPRGWVLSTLWGQAWGQAWGRRFRFPHLNWFPARVTGVGFKRTSSEKAEMAPSRPAALPVLPPVRANQMSLGVSWVLPFPVYFLWLSWPSETDRPEGRSWAVEHPRQSSASSFFSLPT